MAIAAALLLGTAWAQVNHEALVLRSAEPGWGVGGSGRVVTVGGNFSFLDLGTDGFVHGRTPFEDAPNDAFWFKDRLLLLGRFQQQSVFGTRFRLERLAHLRYTRMFVHRVGLEVFVQEQNDQNLLLDNRFVAGLEPRFVFVHTEAVGVWAATGYMFELENRDEDQIAPGFDEFTVAHRSTTYVSLNWHPTEHVSLSNTAFLQPKLDDLTDVHVLDEFELVVGITDKVSLFSGFRLRYDSRAPDRLVQDGEDDNDDPIFIEVPLAKLDHSTHHGIRVDF